MCLALLLQKGLFAMSSNRESSSPTFIPSRLGCICWEEVSFSCLWSDPTMRMFQNKKKTQNNSIMKTRSLLLKCIKATIRASFSWQLVDKTLKYCVFQWQNSCFSLCRPQAISRLPTFLLLILQYTTDNLQDFFLCQMSVVSWRNATSAVCFQTVLKVQMLGLVFD